MIRGRVEVQVGLGHSTEEYDRPAGDAQITTFITVAEMALLAYFRFDKFVLELTPANDSENVRRIRSSHNEGSRRALIRKKFAYFWSNRLSRPKLLFVRTLFFRSHVCAPSQTACESLLYPNRTTY